MSKEAYVSFEIAKLLKEKGFDIPVGGWYVNKDNNFTWADSFEFLDHYDDYIPTCTQQMACRWLREEHNICISIIPCEVGAGVMDYTYCIYEIQADDYHFEPICQGRIEPVAYTCDYEGTVETALKSCLTNLI